LADHSQSDHRQRALEHRARLRREARNFQRRLAILLIALLAVIAAGSVTLSLVEHYSVGYGFVLTLDTVTTLGSIQTPHNAAGRVVIVVLEILGIGTLFYGLATVAEFFVSGQLTGLLTNLETAEAMGIRFIESYAADDEVLLGAGIRRARAVIACVDSDADNIFIALTARELAPDILIVARASVEDSEKKLRRAGADRVISPYKTSGAEMARVAIHPQVGGAVQVADFRLEEIEVPMVCEGVGKTLQEVCADAAIVAVRRTDGELVAQPESQTVVAAGDMLVAIGTPAALEQLELTFQPITVPSA
jgi:voltage-gated potassium channel